MTAVGLQHHAELEEFVARAEERGCAQESEIETLGRAAGSVRLPGAGAARGAGGQRRRGARRLRQGGAGDHLAPRDRGRTASRDGARPTDRRGGRGATSRARARGDPRRRREVHIALGCDAVRRAVAELAEPERSVIRLRFGLDEMEPDRQGDRRAPGDRPRPSWADPERGQGAGRRREAPRTARRRLTWRAFVSRSAPVTPPPVARGQDDAMFAPSEAHRRRGRLVAVDGNDVVVLRRARGWGHGLRSEGVHENGVACQDASRGWWRAVIGAGCERTVSSPFRGGASVEAKDSGHTSTSRESMGCRGVALGARDPRRCRAGSDRGCRPSATASRGAADENPYGAPRRLPLRVHRHRRARGAIRCDRAAGLGRRRPWWRRRGHELVLEDLEEVLEELPEHLLVGTGAQGRMR